MTALAAERARRVETWKYKDFTLAVGNKAWKGGRAAVLLGTNTVVPASSAPGLFVIGSFAETVDATAAAKTVSVDLEREIVLERYVNATSTDACASTNLCGIAYLLDDQTATITPTGRSVAGRIWDVDSTKGVAIEKLDLASPAAVQPATGSFTSNDYAPAAITNGAIYAVPTTAAASTITLPAAAPNGTIAYFAANGTANGHTVQYRDETGPTNLTTALVASKRHLVVVSKLAGNWVANAYVSP
jgi:hypothetical protein